jgi:hypothetical protein
MDTYIAVAQLSGAATLVAAVALSVWTTEHVRHH